MRPVHATFCHEEGRKCCGFLLSLGGLTSPHTHHTHTHTTETDTHTHTHAHTHTDTHTHTHTHALLVTPICTHSQMTLARSGRPQVFSAQGGTLLGLAQLSSCWPRIYEGP